MTTAAPKGGRRHEDQRGASVTGRTVAPHNPEAEAAVLSAVLVAPAAWPEVSGIITTAEAFYQPWAQTTFAEIADLHAQGITADWVLVKDGLERKGRLEGGVVDHLDELLRPETAPFASNAARYARIVAEDHQRRQLAALAADLSLQTHNGAPPAESAHWMLEQLSRFRPIGGARGVAPEALDWAALYEGQGAEEDWLVEDLWPAGRAISIIAERKHGKSLLMFWVACCLARGVDPWSGREREPITVGYFDYEQTEEDVRERAQDQFEIPFEQLTRLRYYLLPSIPPLDTPQGGREVLEIVERDGARAVIFDTWGRTVEGGENETDTVRAYYRCTAQPLKRIGVATARTDHTGHQHKDRARGTSGKGEDVDVAWILKRDEGNGVTLDHYGVTRLRWVPRKLPLVLVQGPPDRYGRAAESWPAGTKECAGLLTRLEVPLYATRREAERILRDAGQGRRSEVVSGGLRWRLERSGTTPLEEPWPPTGTKGESDDA